MNNFNSRINHIFTQQDTKTCKFIAFNFSCATFHKMKKKKKVWNPKRLNHLIHRVISYYQMGKLRGNFKLSQQNSK